MLLIKRLGGGDRGEDRLLEHLADGSLHSLRAEKKDLRALPSPLSWSMGWLAPSF